ncbi:carotenoid biosynthesis protein [Nocardia sp. CA-107356]|uniref:carotenoid biosynthesis protein n=1 Tax=Nocardia sp. CA-107356 TaxID=3239972 RepID=UPI003D8D8442
MIEPEPIEGPTVRTPGPANPEVTHQIPDGADSDVRRFDRRPARRPGPPDAPQDRHSTGLSPGTPRFLAPVGFAVLLVLVQISYPLSSGVTRDRVTIAVVLLSAGTALVHAAATRGVRYAVGFLVIVSGLGLLAEIVGTATGFPFGCYDYADGRSGPAVAGVPLVVALAWTGGLYPVRVVAELLTRRTAGRIALTAVGAVGWDLFLDPQMVADGQWLWCATGWGLPGLDEIPYTNYLGWFAVALVMAVLLTALDRMAGTRAVSAFAVPTARESQRLGSLIPIGALVPVAVFVWTWLGSTLAHAVFLDLPYSAWYGCVGLGVLGVPLLVRLAGARRD